MKHLVLLILGLSLVGCAARRTARLDLSDYPQGVRHIPGTVNTTFDTGNSPDVLNPHNLSDY
jgi:hypothetical protein